MKDVTGDRAPAGSDAAYLRGEQYRDARNLNSRIDLHRRFSVNRHGWTRWLFDLLLAAVSGAERAEILELGCGAGTLWRQNGSRLPAGWTLLLTDFSEGMVQESRRSLGERARYAVADAQAIPAADGRFDVILANHMLYHVPDRARAVREIARALAPGGVLVASTVGERHMAEIDTRLVALGLGEELLGRAMSAGFTLENGGAQLGEAFGEVRSWRYEDALRVTQVEPLMAYVASMGAGTALTARAVEELRAGFAAEIAARGFVSIAKESGAFVARRPRRLRPESEVR